MLYKQSPTHREMGLWQRQSRDRKPAARKGKSSVIQLTSASTGYYVEGCGAGCVSPCSWGSAYGRPNLWGEAMWP